MGERVKLWLSTRGRAGLWRRYGWLVIGLLWIVALALGCTGFALSAPGSGRSGRFFDVAYRTLQLVTMDSGDVDSASWQLGVARFLIPILAAWTTIRALLSLFRDRWQQALLRFWRDHVIICGLSRKGWLLAQGFAARGDRVVVLEANESHDLIGPCRERGIPVVTGDATEPDLLRQAGLQWARHLVAVTDDDGVNAEIALRAQDALRTATESGRNGAGRRYPLTCTVHLVDPQLHELVRTREMALGAGAPFRLELFNVFDRAARLLWSQFGPAMEGPGGAASAGDGQGAGCSAHVLVIGLGRLGESLVVCAARDRHTRRHETPCRVTGRLRITVADVNAEWKCRALSLRYPRLAGVCDLVPLAMNVRWPAFYEGAFLAGGADYPPVGVVFVCFDDDSLGLRTGLEIHQRLLQASAGPTPVVVRMAETGGLARLVEAEGEAVAPFANLYAFGLLDRTCTPETILGGTHEVLARWLHEVYRQQQRGLGHTAETNPALVEWDQLPEVLRESNRAESDGLFLHLAALGYTLVPLSDWDAAFFRFSEPEVARLAEAEHNRFVEERRRLGWRYVDGPKKIGAGLSPALVPWEALSEDERIKTRDTVRELPTTLARAGFQIVRLKPAERPASSPPAPAESPLSTEAERREIMARAMHERYRENQRGIKPPDDPAMQPWEALDEPLRESNRQQAGHIEATLRRIGCGVRPAAGRAPASFRFTDEEVETMASLAREQWVAERRQAGWVSGAERDVARKVTPYLDRSYADLPEEVKEWDRQAVRAIPEVLAAAGLEVYRLG